MQSYLFIYIIYNVHVAETKEYADLVELKIIRIIKIHF